MNQIFLRTLPKYLCIKPPDDDAASDDGSNASGISIMDRLETMFQTFNGWGPDLDAPVPVSSR
jgi:hypothetical protein